MEEKEAGKAGLANIYAENRGAMPPLSQPARQTRKPKSTAGIPVLPLLRRPPRPASF